MTVLKIVTFDNPVGEIDISKITAITRHTNSGCCTIAFTNASGQTVSRNFYGQDGMNLYSGLVALCAIIPSSTT